MHDSLLVGKQLKRTIFFTWTAVVWCLWMTRNRIIPRRVADYNSLINQIKVVSWSWFIKITGTKFNVDYLDWLKCALDSLSNVNLFLIEHFMCKLCILDYSS
jgi:hypothetical protein